MFAKWKAPRPPSYCTMFLTAPQTRKHYCPEYFPVCARAQQGIGSEFPASRSLYFWFLPPSVVTPFWPLCAFSIAKYCAIKLTFFLAYFSGSAPDPVGIPPPAPSSPASYSLPAPITPGFPLPHPLPTATVQKRKHRTTFMSTMSVR